MASGQFAVACHQIGRLFGAGTTAGLSEGQLLDRFVARRDGPAFEAIVARHGPMVLAVCRSLLRDPNDVDDAFQATFLVLVRKAETLRRRDLLGGWLHAVAGRVARRARYEASRRRDREAKYPTSEGWTEPEADRTDFRAAVHAEVDRLPESFRLAVLLCDLQGRTHDEAARELGWPVGTVKGRLHRARALLRGRLVRRGLAPSAGALAALLAAEGRAAVPPGLLESTASSASAVAAGPLAVAASARILELTQGVLTTMTMTTTRLKLATTALVVVALIGPGASAYQFVPGSTPPRQPAQGPAEVAKASATPGSFSAEARIRLAHQAIQMLKQREAAGQPASTDDMLTWQRRLAEARIESGAPRAEVVQAYILAVNEVMNRAKNQASVGDKSPVDLLDAEFRRIEASKFLETPATPGANPAAPQPAVGGGGIGGGMGGIGAAGGGLEGGFGGADAAARPVRPRKQHSADLERNKAIEERLEKAIAMNFSTETPLEDVLKYIKEATKDAKGKTIPIYLDPIGLQEAEKTPQSTVTMDIEDVPLRTTLRLMLVQLSLDYRVRDGMIYIGSRDTLEEEDQAAEDQQKLEEISQRRLHPPGLQ